METAPHSVAGEQHAAVPPIEPSRRESGIRSVVNWTVDIDPARRRAVVDAVADLRAMLYGGFSGVPPPNPPENSHARD
jgi:hypothetical protein